MRFKAAFLALLGGSLSLLPAQLDRATLTGAVTDSSGAVVPSAVLSVSSEETGLRRSAQTSDNGTYTFSAVADWLVYGNGRASGFAVGHDERCKAGSR
jgi:hypothetical protein